jgi:hypothetical protein
MPASAGAPPGRPPRPSRVLPAHPRIKTILRANYAQSARMRGLASIVTGAHREPVKGSMHERTC